MNSNFFKDLKNNKIALNRGLLIFLSILCIVVGIYMRIKFLSFPSQELAEEPFFTNAARGYINGVWVYQDHPPLGILFVTIGMLLFGDNPVGWHISSLMFGLLLILVTFLLVENLSKSKIAGLVAAALVSIDGLFFLYSRLSLLDGILVFFIPLLLLVVRTIKKNIYLISISIIILGSIFSIKWLGLFVLGPFSYILYKQKRLFILLYILPGILMFQILLLGYSRYIIGVQHPFLDSLSWLKFAWHFHSTQLVGQGARWWTWPFMIQPFYLWSVKVGDKIVSTIILANIVVLYATTVGLICNFYYWIRKKIDDEKTILIVGWLSFYVPWIFYIKRLSLIYHYLPSYYFAICCLALFLIGGPRRYYLITNMLLVVGLICFLFYLPVWTNQPITEAQYQERILFDSWMPKDHF